MKIMKCLFSVLLLGVLIISGGDEQSSVYSGIEKNDIHEISISKNIEFVYEYKGRTNHWAANYIVYKMKETDAEIETGDIYSHGTSGGNGALAAQDSVVKIKVYWNGRTEEIELKPQH